MPPPTLDWNDVRYFLAVAKAQRLAPAARALGVDETTVGRRLSALEKRLRASLFARTPAGWQLTAAGDRVHRSAVHMAEAAEELAAHAVDGAAAVDGVVRIATSETIAEHFVVPALRAVRAEHPGVRAIVNTAFGRADLLRGEADLAIRLVRPTDPRLGSRKVADRRFRLFASKAYVAQHGTGGALADLAGHPVITYDEAIRAAGQPFQQVETDGLDVVFAANSARVQVAAALAGLGIVQLPDYIGAATPGLVHVLPAYDRPYRIWLVVPRAKRHVGAIRAVSAAIAEAFA